MSKEAVVGNTETSVENTEDIDKEEIEQLSLGLDDKTSSKEVDENTTEENVNEETNIKPEPEESNNSENAEQERSETVKHLDDIANLAFGKVRRVESVTPRDQLEEDEEHEEYDDQELEEMLGDDEVVVKFANPKGRGKPIVFYVTPLTPGQFAAIHETLFGRTLFEEVKEKLGKDLSEEEMEVYLEKSGQVDKLAEDMKIKAAEVLQETVRGPKGKRYKKTSIRKWSSFYIDTLYNAAMRDVTATTAVSRFPEMDEKSEK